MILSMGIAIIKNKKVVIGTCREDSVALYFSSLEVPQDFV